MASDEQEKARSILLAKHDETAFGTWQIFGEDPNCDLGGAHHEPTLGMVQGTYGSVVEYALELKGFFTWGRGGRIERVEVVKVDGQTMRQRAILNSKRRTLKAQLEDVEAELKKLGMA